MTLSGILIAYRLSAPGVGVQIESGAAPATAAAVASPVEEVSAPTAEGDDDDLDLFGDETEEEAAANAAREEAAKKAKGAKPKVGKYNCSTTTVMTTSRSSFIIHCLDLSKNNLICGKVGFLFDFISKFDSNNSIRPMVVLVFGSWKVIYCYGREAMG